MNSIIKYFIKIIYSFYIVYHDDNSFIQMIFQRHKIHFWHILLFLRNSRLLLMRKRNIISIFYYCIVICVMHGRINIYYFEECYTSSLKNTKIHIFEFLDEKYIYKIIWYVRYLLIINNAWRTALKKEKSANIYFVTQPNISLHFVFEMN